MSKLVRVRILDFHKWSQLYIHKVCVWNLFSTIFQSLKYGLDQFIPTLVQVKIKKAKRKIKRETKVHVAELPCSTFKFLDQGMLSSFILDLDRCVQLKSLLIGERKTSFQIQEKNKKGREARRKHGAELERQISTWSFSFISQYGIVLSFISA